ncbi:MAG: ribosomal protein S18-alanine N-acetyltransferase [Magnetococcales bacterium]|nr:ribosomal protein S18-alanine N-acetyltransferase [Magnetococcales bacterium]
MKLRSMVYEDVPTVTLLDRVDNLRPWTEPMFYEELRLDSFCRVVVDETQTLQAFLVARRLLDEWHLLTLKVAPSCRGQGLARTLMLALIAHGIESDARTILLEVRASNQPAMNLYENLGFLSVGIRKNYYPGPTMAEDAVIMERRTDRKNEFNPF